MKICLVGNPNSAHTRHFIEGLLERGFQVALIGDHTPLQSPPKVITFYDLAQKINIPRLRYLVWGLMMPSLLRKIKPDILHSIGASGAAWLSAASNYHPFVITATGSDLLLLNQRSALHNWLTRRALLHADYVLCLGEHVKQAALKLNVSQSKIETAIFGIDTNIFYPLADQFNPTQLPNNATGPVVLSLRAMDSIYNPLVIARAIPSVIQAVPSARFLIMTYNANPHILEQFQEIISLNQVENAVMYLPPLRDDVSIATTLHQCDIAISVPASDGTPVSVLESMACGNALIVSDLPSLHYWLAEEQSALFVAPGDDVSLSEAIIRLAQDPNLRIRLGCNAANFARENASQTRQFDQLERIYLVLHG